VNGGQWVDAGLVTSLPDLWVGVAAGQPLSVRVRAVKAGEPGTSGSVDTVMPAAPTVGAVTGLTVVSKGWRYANLVWGAPSSFAGYLSGVYRVRSVGGQWRDVTQGSSTVDMGDVPVPQLGPFEAGDPTPVGNYVRTPTGLPAEQVPQVDQPRVVTVEVVALSRWGSAGSVVSLPVTMVARYTGFVRGQVSAAVLAAPVDHHAPDTFTWLPVRRYGIGNGIILNNVPVVGPVPDFFDPPLPPGVQLQVTQQFSGTVVNPWAIGQVPANPATSGPVAHGGGGSYLDMWVTVTGGRVIGVEGLAMIQPDTQRRTYRLDVYDRLTGTVKLSHTYTQRSRIDGAGPLYGQPQFGSPAIGSYNDIDINLIRITSGPNMFLANTILTFVFIQPDPIRVPGTVTQTPGTFRPSTVSYTPQETQPG
jgi:hypothetical protein